MKRIYRKVKSKYKNYKENYDIANQRGKKVDISISDMVFINTRNNEIIRYDMIVRYLAIENYYGINDIGFSLYKRMQDARMGEGFSDGAVERFKALIESYEKNGYDENSCIIVDKNLQLIDGSHRMALGLYYGMMTIKALIIDTEHPVDYSIDWFFTHGFSNDEIDKIIQKAAEIKCALNQTFSCIIWAPAVTMKEQILRDLQYFATINKVQEFHYKKGEYDNVVRALYAIDDIEKWKIEKKIEYMNGYSGDLIAVELQYEAPLLRIKKSSNLPISTHGERIKKVIRTKYSKLIDNYFYDIILHIGDNYAQSEYMKKVLYNDVNSRDFIDILNKYKYVLTKMDVPYMPQDFPNRFPVGKDMDILCTEEDASLIKKAFVELCKGKYTDLSLRVLESKYNTRIRLEFMGHLIYQFDMTWKVDSLNGNYIEDAIACRREINGYYTMDMKYEYIFRMICYLKNKAKKYHLVYLQEHKKEYDKVLANKYTTYEIEDILSE